MISELAGFTLSRTIPDSAMMGVLTGAYKVYGGVIRDKSGQIVAHLVNTAAPGNLLSAFASPVSAVLSGINSFQLHRIGADVTQLLSLAKGTMFLSGLTLAASAAGFLFLSNKVNRIDKELQGMAKDIKSIKTFLDLQERSRLITAIKAIRDLEQLVNEANRFHLLASSRQTLGEIHEKYKTLLQDNRSVDGLMAVEEYYTITAIGHAMCSAELGLHDQAANDLSDAHKVWQEAVRSFVSEHVVKEDPERFLTKKYAKVVKTEEVIDWLDFAESAGKGLERIDELRSCAPKVVNPFSSISKPEEISINVTRKLIEREKVLQGYVSQYKYYAKIGQRPSEVDRFVSKLPPDKQVNDFYMFVSTGLLPAA